MINYTEQKIKDFIEAANRDLGSRRYSGDSMIPDYCKSINICKQLQRENEDLRNADRDHLSEKRGSQQRSKRKLKHLQNRIDKLEKFIVVLTTTCECKVEKKLPSELEKFLNKIFLEVSIKSGKKKSC